MIIILWPFIYLVICTVYALDFYYQHVLMLASALRQSGQLRDAMSNASTAVQVLLAALPALVAKSDSSYHCSD